MFGFMASTTTRGQAVYATPYAFATIAGSAGNYGGADGTNGAAQFTFPIGVVLATNGNLYVVDNTQNDVRQIALRGTNWVVTTIAGAPGSFGGYVDGTNQDAQFNSPTSIAMDAAGNLYVADGDNNTLRKLTPMGTNWVVTTIAGIANFTGGSADGTNGAAQFNYPSGITVDTASNLYVADTYNETIRRVSPMGTNWVVTTIAGTAGLHPGAADGTNQAAQFSLPTGITTDGSGNLYVTDASDGNLRKIIPVGTNWVVSTIAGTGGNDNIIDGTNTDAQFSAPNGITVDVSGNLYVADSGNNAIRKVTPIGTNWVTTTLAGGISGTNDGVGPDAQFNNPSGIAVDAAGNLFVADSNNSIIRKGFIGVLPNLTIYLSALTNVVVSWPGSFGTLQTNADLTTTNWGGYGGTIVNNNGTNSVTLSPSAGALFFRLTN